MLMLLNCITFHTMGNRRQSVLDRHPCVIIWFNKFVYRRCRVTVVDYVFH